MTENFLCRRLLGPDASTMRAVNALFGDVFEDPDSYGTPPADAWLETILSNPHVIVLAAQADGAVVGGLVAYVLDKLEQPRREIYIYDLAVAEAWRRRGIATALIGEVQAIAADIDAWVIYVQADPGDDPALALYESLGTREAVFHFDIVPRRRGSSG